MLAHAAADTLGIAREKMAAGSQEDVKSKTVAGVDGQEFEKMKVGTKLAGLILIPNSHRRYCPTF